jgi:hypothetical protein
MSNTHQNRYDEIKDLLRKSRVILEQSTITEQAVNDSGRNAEVLGQRNIGKSIQDRIENDVEYETAEDGDDVEESSADRSQAYRISGGVLVLHGKDLHDTDISTDDKIAFQETMDEFIDEVSDLVDFNELNVYPNNVEWSGKIIDYDLDFTFSIGESNGVYIDGDMIKVDEDFTEFINKLRQYYEKFKAKWARVIASRKQTEPND